MRVIRLLLVLFICAVPAAADTIYQVTGSATITGNPVCAELPCVETVNFSFLVSYLFEFPNAYDEHLVSVISLTSSGPLAAFNTIHATSDYFAFFNSANDEIDINGPFGDGELAPRPFPDLIDSELYGCGGGVDGASPVCVQDFVPPGGPTYGHVIFGTVQYTASAVPEGSTRSYLLVGVGLGLLGMLARTQVR
jgi:hypothetical protein